jgi:hypothetical protein
MDILLKLLPLALQGVSIIQALAQNGKDIMPVVTALKNIFSKRPEDITDADLDEVEAVLDAQIDEFELPMKKLKK